MIGYYAHHHGAGHLQRAVAVSGHVASALTVLSSAQPSVGIPHLPLARDDDAPVIGDVTASGALHWVPLRHKGFRERSSQIVGWAAQERCNLLVSDVSVEVLLLARLLSIPSVAVALRGPRQDRPHAIGYDVASRIIAPWPRATQGEGLQQWRDKTIWVGAVSRFDGRVRETGRCGRPGRCTVVLLGRGGDSMTALDLREAAAVPGTHWHLLGGSAATVAADRQPSSSPTAAGGEPRERVRTVEVLGWVADPWPVLCRADVVVAAAGDAAIADVAAAGRPLIAVPQDRPFGEQHDHAAVLARHRLCLSEPTWPDRQRWPLLLDRAQALGGRRWAEYCDGQGSARMARVLQEIADDGPGDPEDGPAVAGSAPMLSKAG